MGPSLRKRGESRKKDAANNSETKQRLANSSGSKSTDIKLSLKVSSKTTGKKRGALTDTTNSMNKAPTFPMSLRKQDAPGASPAFREGVIQSPRLVRSGKKFSVRKLEFHKTPVKVLERVVENTHNAHKICVYSNVDQSDETQLGEKVAVYEFEVDENEPHRKKNIRRFQHKKKPTSEDVSYSVPWVTHQLDALSTCSPVEKKLRSWNNPDAAKIQQSQVASAGKAVLQMRESNLNNTSLKHDQKAVEIAKIQQSHVASAGKPVLQMRESNLNNTSLKHDQKAVEIAKIQQSHVASAGKAVLQMRESNLNNTSLKYDQKAVDVAKIQQSHVASAGKTVLQMSESNLKNTFSKYDEKAVEVSKNQSCVLNENEDFLVSRSKALQKTYSKNESVASCVELTPMIKSPIRASTSQKLSGKSSGISCVPTPVASRENSLRQCSLLSLSGFSQLEDKRDDLSHSSLNDSSINQSRNSGSLYQNVSARRTWSKNASVESGFHLPVVHEIEPAFPHLSGIDSLRNAETNMKDLTVNNCFGFEEEPEDDVLCSPVRDTNNENNKSYTRAPFAISSTPAYKPVVKTNPGPTRVSPRTQRFWLSQSQKKLAQPIHSTKKHMSSHATHSSHATSVSSTATSVIAPSVAATSVSQSSSTSDPTAFSPVPALVQSKLNFVTEDSNPEPAQPTGSPSLFKDMDETLIHFHKPPRKSYERPKRKFDPGLLHEEDWSDGEAEEKKKVPHKAKESKKSKQEKRLANKWIADFNSKCEEVEDFVLCVE